MTQYIEPNDYDASVHREIIDAITREDNSILDICEDRAIEERNHIWRDVMTWTGSSPPEAKNGIR